MWQLNFPHNLSIGDTNRQRTKMKTQIAKRLSTYSLTDVAVIVAVVALVGAIIYPVVVRS